MKSKLMHNLGLKIMAVLISVVLWMLAVDINDPVINKYINNVQVQLTNTGALTGQGKTYRVVDNSDPCFRARTEVCNQRNRCAERDGKGRPV